MRAQSILQRPGRRPLAVMQLDEPVRRAVEYLASAEVRSLLVVSGKELVGIVTVRDLLRTLAAHGGAAMDRPLREAMTQDLATVSPSDDLSVARALFETRKVNHVPVVRDGEPVGVLTMADVLGEHLEDVRAFSEDLRRYIHGQHVLSA